jgi:hypothetical protein
MNRLRQGGHTRVHGSAFQRALGSSRDGWDDMYEPLTLQKVEAGVQDLIQKGKLAIDGEFLILK